jgi:hypothetical protein
MNGHCCGDGTTGSARRLGTYRGRCTTLRARIDLLRAQIAFASSRGKEAPPVLQAAAHRPEPLDGGLAHDHFDAFSAAMFAGRQPAALDAGCGIEEVLRDERYAG